MLKYAIVFFVPFMTHCLHGEEKAVPTTADRELLLDAIRFVESANNPRAVGDNGMSRGAYQCQEAAWTDARVAWPYLPSVWDEEKSREVCRRYCTRYAGKNGTLESWARTWNGGPRGRFKKATLSYWEKVQTAMQRIAEESEKKPAENKSEASGATHTIAEGDTLWALARRYNTTVERLISLNPGVIPTRLQIGQKIIIP